MSTETRDDRDEWAPVIGRLFIAFGAIESITHQCLKEWLSDPIYNDLKKSRLSFRLDLLESLLVSKEYTDEDKSNCLNIFPKIKNLASVRNLVAHNPLELVLFVEEGGVFQEIMIPSVDPSKELELEELKKKVDEVEALASDFSLSVAPFGIVSSW